MLPWIDIETTGLDSNKDTILEVGVLLASDNLEKIGVNSWQVKFSSRDAEQLDDFIKKMHTDNGLLHTCARHGIPAEHVESKVLGFLEQYGYQYGSAPMCGSSVHFDRGFLKKYMPNLHDAFHYRNIDTSAVKEMARRWAPSIADSMPEKRETHRAAQDLEDTLELARYFKSFLFDPAEKAF